MLRVLTSVATCPAPTALKVGFVARGLHALITGPPAAGKGTISERIIRDFPLKHISSGQALRDQVLVARATARWTHPGSGRVYSLDFNPPKVAGKDDVTGEPLIQREDDKEETVRNRLSKYHALTKPLLAYYESQGKLVSFTGETSNIIYPQVQKYLASLNL